MTQAQSAEARSGKPQDEDLIRLVEGAATLQEAARPILRGLCSAMGWQFAALWAEAGDLLRCVDTWRQDDGLDTLEGATRHMTFAKGDTLPGHVWATGRVEWIPDLAAVEEVYRAPAAVEAGMRGVVAFPVATRDRVVGVIEFFSRVVEEPDESLIQMLADVGQSVGMFIEADRIRRALALQNEQLVSVQRWSSFLAEVSEVLSRSLDLHESLQEVAELAVPVLGDRCAIFLTDGDDDVRLYGMAEAGRSPGDGPPTDAPFVGIARPGASDVVSTGESVLLEDLSVSPNGGLPRYTSDLLALHGLGLRSAIAVPLACRGRVLGAMVLATERSGRRYSSEDLRLAEDVASRAAFPIDNARLYEERDRVARTLQSNLLPPRIPDIPGTELAVRYEPAGTGAEIGGDFYDVFPIGDDTWCVVVGDVSGKGVGAATVTSLARHAIRTAAMATDRPSRILAMLNAALLEEAMGTRLCTAVLAVLRPRFGRLTAVVCRAGHPYPYIVRSDGTLEIVEDRGQLLGAVSNPELHDIPVELGFGDKLVLYTDGVIELRSEQRFDEQRFEWLLRECSLKGADRSAELIASTVMGLQDARLSDDLALMVVGVRSSIFRRLGGRRRRPRWPRSAPLRGRLRAIEDEARATNHSGVRPE